MPRIPPALALAVLAEVAFLLALPRYVTVDGAAHVGGAALIRDVLQGAGELHLRYVEFTSFPAPNLLPGLALSLVMLVVDPGLAEKMLQIAYVVLLPLALLYAVRSVRSDNDWLALLAVPFTFTFAFQYGFYDFSFGVALFLIAAGYAWRHREAPGWREALGFALLALVVYLTHAVPFLELVAFGASTASVRIFRSWRAGGRRAAATTLRSLAPFLIGAAPSVALAVVFFVSTRSAAPDEYLNPVLQAIGVVGLALGLVTTHPLEVGVAVVLALTLAGLLVAALWRRTRDGESAGEGATGRPGRRGLRDEDALFGYAAAALVLALVAPGSVQSGGSYIPERLALFPVYGLALWLAAHEIPRSAARVAGTAFIVTAFSILVLRLPTTLSLSAAAVEFESIAACVAPRSTMFQASLAQLPAGPLGRTDPFGDEAGRVASATGGHDLGNWEAHFPFFLYRNLPDSDPFRWLITSPDGFGVPPQVDIEAFASRPDGTVDYVLVMGRPLATSETLSSPGWMSLDGELGDGYARAAVSESGLVEVWERNDPALQSAGAARRAVAGGVCAPR